MQDGCLHSVIQVIKLLLQSSQNKINDGMKICWGLPPAQ